MIADVSIRCLLALLKLTVIFATNTSMELLLKRNGTRACGRAAMAGLPPDS
jgi:hypothetical protein